MVGASSRTSASTSLRKPLLVGGRMAGLEDAAIDAAAEMLDEGAEQPRVGVADGEIAIQADVDVTQLLGDFGVGDVGSSGHGGRLWLQGRHRLRCLGSLAGLLAGLLRKNGRREQGGQNSGK